MTNLLDDHVENFHVAIKEVLSQLDLESAHLFLEVFNQRIKELHEQTNLQENSGASR
jgi:hypothetical protein